MTPLHRHQIAWLSDVAWQQVQEVQAHTWDAVAQECLQHWASHRLPLVVTRQTASEMPRSVALGLPAPARWDKRRITLAVPRSAVLYFDAFPRALEVQCLLPLPARAPWLGLCEQLSACHATARVYGSYGWQRLTGLDHVHADSDIDLCIAVSNASQADAVAALLQGFAAPRVRLDGELVFDDGAAVAWREWAAWRAGRSNAVLVKRLLGATLERAPFWHSTLPRPLALA
ncbi:MAG: malonate decarboxylase holo-[acyl-carrier-protein] synthase [Rhodoferax sp.]|uniref:malonate decarboxylase holo-[acyl-carrier-protein] synthase n=1 Tax=Rhodoferax sp. TaxID=50421 RepID=UPI0032642F3B